MRAFLAALPAAALLAVPAAAEAPPYDPPRWFEKAVARMKARDGAKCPGPKSSTGDYTVPLYDGEPPDPSPRAMREERIEEDCARRLPKALAKTFPVLRGSGFHGRYREGCHGHTSHIGHPDGSGLNFDEIFYRCDIWYRPVIDGKPNARSWQCWRSRATLHQYEGNRGHTSRGGKPFWFAEDTKYWRDQRFRTLKACLNPRLRELK
jgi:hypothetical protein